MFSAHDSMSARQVVARKSDILGLPWRLGHMRSRPNRTEGILQAMDVIPFEGIAIV